jgi:hypothetical protein
VRACGAGDGRAAAERPPFARQLYEHLCPFLAPELAARLLDGSYSGDLAQDLLAMLVKHDHRAACGHLGVAAALVQLAAVATVGFGAVAGPAG